LIEIIWEFVVKKDFQGQFELAYGPGGAWSKLFSRIEGFRGTTLLRDRKNAQRYLTIDIWDTLEQRDRMLIQHEAEYNELASRFAGWIESMRELGVFTMMAEATVRPSPRAGRRKTGRTRRPRG
jgi:hypothetical protein